MLTKETVSSWDSKRVESEMRDRLDELKAIKAAHGGSFEGITAQEAGTLRRVNGELETLGERLDEARGTEGVSEQSAAYGDYVGKLEDYFEKPASGLGVTIPHGRIPGGGASGEQIKPVASMWDAMRSAGFELGKQNRVTVPPGVIWGAVTSPTDTLAPSRRDVVVPMGVDRRYIFPSLLTDPLSPLTTAVDWARQSVRALATTASMRRAITAISTKPESAFTVVLVHSACEQLAHKIAAIPNIVFRQPGIRNVIDSELRIGLAEALDAQVVAIVNASGMTVGGTGASLPIRIRKAMTTLMAQGFTPTDLALSPTDAETLDLLLLELLNSTGTAPNWGLRVRIGKSVTTGFVYDRSAFATVHASPLEVASFEEADGATNSQLARAEFNAITTVDQVAAGVALGAQV